MRYRRRPVFLPPRLQLVLAFLAVFGTNTACLVRARKPDPKPVINQTASLEELTARVERFEAIRTLKATVQLQISFVTADEESVKEFSNVRGFILIRRPQDIRVLAQVPVVRTTALEMTSTGKTFQVHLPSKKRFLVGETAVDKPSPKRVENVRPQHILEGILIAPPRDSGEEALVDNVIEGRQAYHVLNLITEGGELRLSRKIWFERTNLEIVRQQIYDGQGNVGTDAWYQEWSEEDGIPLPHYVYISRPGDGYSLQVRITKADLNGSLPEDAFLLEPPPGTKVERIGESKESALAGDSAGSEASGR